MSSCTTLPTAWIIAAGVDMGRNIFQSDHPIAMLKAVGRVVHEQLAPADAYEFFREQRAGA